MDHSDVLYKLVQLHTRCPEMLDHIYHLALASPDCTAALRNLEVAAGDKTESAAKSQPVDREVAELLERRREVREILLGGPKFSTADQQVLAVLASIADIRPNGKGALITRDGPFAYIVALTEDEEGTTTIERITQEFVTRLIDLNGKAMPLLGALREFCSRPDYRDIVNQFNAWLEAYSKGSDLPKDSSKECKQLLSLCDSMLASPVSRSVLYGSPRVSQIPTEFIQFFPLGERQEPDEADSDASLDALQRRSGRDREILEAMVRNPQTKLVVELRLDAALDFQARRGFVKAQILEFGWPRLMSYVRAPGGQSRLLELERAVHEPARQRSLSARWQEFLADERLVDFLKMPPYFREIRRPEFSGSEFGIFGDAAADGTVPEQESAAGGAAVTGDESAELPHYADVHFTLSAPEDELSGEGELSGAVTTGGTDGGFVAASLELSFAGRQRKLDVSIPVGEVSQLLAGLSYSYRESYVSSSRVVSKMATAGNDRLPPPRVILEEIGSKLWNALLMDSEEHNSLLDFLGAQKRVRFAITCTGRHLGDMPWECLYIPALQLFAGLVPNISVVRNVLRPNPLVRREIDGPLRVLLVSSLPRNAPWLNADQEITLIRRVLEPAERLGVLRVDELKNPNEELLQGRLRLFHPHILHFIGHGGIGRDGQGAVLLTDENDDGIEVNATDIGTLLRAQGILVAILNSCYTGIAHSDIDRSVASVLVQEGVPLAIAPSRAILDRAALQFAREFYTALVDGYTIEAAVVEARKLLSVKGWDWSTYVTYSTERSRQPEFWPRLPAR